MHADEREQLIFEMMQGRGFVSFQELDGRLDASPATIRRDLERLTQEGRLKRVRGGARLVAADDRPETGARDPHLQGIPFHDNIGRSPRQKAAIGKAAAALCRPGEAVMIDGGSTTLQMCPHLAGLKLQILTNSLHIVSALLPQAGTGILVPSGTVFREQNIILDAAGEDSMPHFHAPRLFMGAAAIGLQGVMQADPVLVAAERKLIERADEIIILVDSSKFDGPSGHVVCELSAVDVIVTDAGVTDASRKVISDAGVALVIAN